MVEGRSLAPCTQINFRHTAACPTPRRQAKPRAAIHRTAPPVIGLRLDGPDQAALLLHRRSMALSQSETPLVGFTGNLDVLQEVWKFFEHQCLRAVHQR